MWIKMGSIASVLQWHCQTCGQINPTESVKCLKCGTKRVSSHDTESSKQYFGEDSSPEYGSRTEKSEGTTPGSEPIVIPVTNNFKRWIFRYKHDSFVVPVIQNIDFSWPLLGYIFHSISLLGGDRGSSLAELSSDIVFAVGVCHCYCGNVDFLALLRKCSWVCNYCVIKAV